MRVNEQGNMTQRTQQTKSLKWTPEILDLKNVLEIRLLRDAEGLKSTIGMGCVECRPVVPTWSTHWVETQPWRGVVTSTSEHIHRERLDMHAGQFFLGMK